MPSTNTAPAARALTLPLGTGPEGQELTWQLADHTGRPLHGLVVGLRGSGGSTALARLAAGARTAGVRTLVVSLDHGSDYPDPAWSHAPWGTCWCVDADDLVRDMTALLAQIGPSPAPLLALVDGASALLAAPGLWAELLRQAARLQISMVARVYTPSAGEFGEDVLHSRLAADGQYLALGRLRTTPALMSDALPGYTPPVYRQEPGRGVYGLGGTATPITVTPFR
ncbi:hypothetical protein [Nocardiopsis tropica]|uniref:Uncharacterized protein n=1 Tax=Nocardiopsis tropica TaxID=109330 RepID=A0ABV2A5T6_9ACTN